MRSPALRILLLTEDTARDAHATVEALLKYALKQIEPECNTHPEVLRIDPASGPALAASKASYWKSRRHPHRVDLIKTIVTTLCEQAPAPFVVFHIDGDTKWSERSTSDNAIKFDGQLATAVRTGLQQHFPNNPARVDEALSRFLPLVPFYSVESWLYQHQDEARRICQELGNPPELLEQLDGWASDRTQLDELREPKNRCKLGSSYNRRLAKGWPADDVYALDRSFTTSVDRLRACAALATALRATAQ